MEEQKLSYKAMQEALPDYAFGRLSESEARAFEASLPDYPDLQAELKGVREVFARVDRMDFDAAIERRSRNVSSKVLSRLESRRKSAPTWRKVALPSLGLVAMVLIALNIVNIPYNKTNDANRPKVATQPAGEVTLNIIDSSDVSGLLEDTKDTAATRAAVDDMLSQTPTLMDDDEYDSADVAEALDISADDAFSTMSQADIESIVYDQINNLTEEEFQNYVMGMKDVPLKN